MPKLNDRVFVVTGASSGIGEAIACELVESGAKVILLARREDRLHALTKKLGANAISYKSDVTDVDSMRTAIDDAIKKFGHIDGLINNAGVMPISRMENCDLPVWHQIIDTNVTGVLNGIAVVLPHLLKNETADIVNIGSVASLVVIPGNVVYCAAKHAVRVISEGLRKELAGRVRVTEINPGAVATELISATNEGETLNVLRERYKGALPAKTVAEAVRFAVEQPPEISFNEITLRPSKQEV